jgi:predicted DNA-binding transcriptional regulator AlpA
MAHAKKKPAAQVAPARKAAKLKSESKAKPTRPASDDLPRTESDAPVATPISASPRGPPPRRFHFDKRIDSIVSAPGDDDDLLTTSQMAVWFGVSVQWLDIGRSGAGAYGPPFVRLGPNTVRYHRGKVREWLLARIHHSTSEYGR